MLRTRFKISIYLSNENEKNCFPSQNFYQRLVSENYFTLRRIIMISIFHKENEKRSLENRNKVWIMNLKNMRRLKRRNISLKNREKFIITYWETLLSISLTYYEYILDQFHFAKKIQTQTLKNISKLKPRVNPTKWVKDLGWSLVNQAWKLFWVTFDHFRSNILYFFVAAVEVSKTKTKRQIKMRLSKLLMLTRAQFHQRSTYSFYACGAQKRKKTVKSSVFLRIRDLQA